MPHPAPHRRLGIGVVDPAAAGTHHFGGGDVFGITYTCAAGFFDYGHARDLIDDTRFHHYQLTAGGNNSGGASWSTVAEPGSVTISAPVPPADVIETAGSIAYDEAVWHEIVTWYAMAGGGHNSSFSPEDLVSNFLGAWVGRKALIAGGAFDAAATTELESLMTSLGARPPADTNTAFAKITGRWIAPSTGYFDAGSNSRYLLRRNFNVNPVVPWFAPGISFCSSTTWPSGVPTGYGASITGRYDIEYKVPAFASALGTTLKRSAFAGAITAIKEEAKKPGPGSPGGIERGYGPDFETP